MRYLWGMKPADGATRPSWYESSVQVPKHPAPSGQQTTDVCVVGAGIAGLTTAYLCLKRGLGVIVLDDGPVASGQSGRTSAHLGSYIDDQFVEVEKEHGE